MEKMEANGVPSAAPPLMKTPAAARYLFGEDGRPKTLEVWRCLGKGPKYCKLGGLVYYRREDLDAWISSRVVDPEMVGSLADDR